MKTGQEVIQKEVVLPPKTGLRESLLAYIRLIPGIIVKGSFLGCILISLVIIQGLGSIPSNNRFANYLIVGISIEVLISLGILAIFRNINKLSFYKLSQVVPFDFIGPREKRPNTPTKNRLSSLILYVRKRWLWFTIAIVTDVVIIIWMIQNPPDANSLKYDVFTIILYPLIFPWLLGKLDDMGKVRDTVQHFRQAIPSTLPSRQESIALVIVAIVLMAPIFFSKDFGMPGFVSNYERSGYFNSFQPIYAGNNDSTKVENIVNWSTTHFNDLYAGGVSLTFDPMIMGSLLPPALTLRPDTRNASLASKYVLIVQNGNCEESSLASMGQAQMAGIPVRQVSLHGEDHAFTEMYVDGQWMTIDPLTEYNGNGYDVPPRFYENNWEYKVSYAEATYPNGTIEDVTDRYTDVGTIIVTVVDKNNQRVANASVSVNSLNRANIPTNLTKTTGMNGSVALTIGDGQYTITASNSTLMGSTDNPISLNASEKKAITITLKDMNTLNLVNEINNNDIAYNIAIALQAIIATILTYILLRLYNNRYLKFAIYGFYSILFIFILLTLIKIFIIF